jgi:hypothetical protein
VTLASFFARDGARLRATELTRGPWSEAHQHGGPPAAILTGVLAREGPEADAFRIARVTIAFLKPVPVSGAFEVRIAEPRAGRQAQRLEASLVADGVEVVRASALRIRRVALGRDAVAPVDALADPEPFGSLTFPFFKGEPSYATGMDIRVVEGAWGVVPIGAWGRMRVPLVEGEETTSIERTMVLADAESGIGPPLDPRTYTLLNPELTVYFGREPEGEWIGLRVASYASADGIGLAESRLFDRAGPFGRAAQSLLVRAIG